MLSSIASISLIVGGIGIMNIMLASVVERYKEIGLRLAVGAQKKDIRIAVLTESLALSVGGGLVGIFLGVIFGAVNGRLISLYWQVRFHYHHFIWN